MLACELLVGDVFRFVSGAFLYALLKSPSSTVKGQAISLLTPDEEVESTLYNRVVIRPDWEVELIHRHVVPHMPPPE